MKIVYVTAGPVLRAGTASEPHPAVGEVAIRVCAAGVIVSELQWNSTTWTEAGAVREGAVPSHEFSGVVVAVGPGADSFAVGQEVFGMNGWFRDGALAETCLTEPSCITPKPRNLTHVEAASVPIGALTAWQGLFDRAKLQGSERVLVHGGAGSVGSFVVQFARWKGARIVATASARNLALVENLGADQVLDYQKASFEQAGMFDVIFDSVGGETLERSWCVLNPGGRMVTVAAPASESTDQRMKDAFFIVEPNGRQLGEIGKLLESGTLRTVVDAVFPLDQAPEVYADRVVRRRQGKLVVSIKDC